LVFQSGLPSRLLTQGVQEEVFLFILRQNDTWEVRRKRLKRYLLAEGSSCTPIPTGVKKKCFKRISSENRRFSIAFRPSIQHQTFEEFADF
jgi:hypothetical protein